ncbi:MAG TPA: hypothetical protein VMU53_08415 [Candidatus Sulfotelmatobacter sp.]|nr:hypothetical protein [Candidatus Sulfotelmatobacter sp.]
MKRCWRFLVVDRCSPFLIADRGLQSPITDDGVLWFLITDLWSLVTDY